MELVELLPFCGLSEFLLLTGDQIEALIETTADGKNLSSTPSDLISFPGFGL